MSNSLQSPLFLKKVWALQNKITRYANAHPKQEKFLTSFIDFLNKRLALSPKQKDLLMKEITDIDLDFLPNYEKQNKLVQ